MGFLVSCLVADVGGQDSGDVADLAVVHRGGFLQQCERGVGVDGVDTLRMPLACSMAPRRSKAPPSALSTAGS